MKRLTHQRAQALRSLEAIEEAMLRSQAGPTRRERAPFEAPQDGTEAALARIWTSVLRVQDVGRRDQFFALGGHSLQAMQVLAKVRDALGKEPPLSDLFEAPVLADFAARLDRLAAIAVSPIPVLAREGELPLSPAQQRLWFLHRYEAARANYNMVIRLKMSGTGVSAEGISRVLHRLVERHEPLRTVFRSNGSTVRQIVQPVLEVPVQFVDMSGLAAAEAEIGAAEFLEQDADAPFDLGVGPLLRVALLRFGAAQHVLQLTLHHIASDGWSMGVVVHDVAQIYRAQQADELEALPPLLVQYADYAAWQCERLAGGALDEHLAYWRRQLQDVPALLELPTDRPRPALQTYTGASLNFRVALSLRKQLRDVAEEHGATLFMVLQAVFAILLHRYSGQCDFCVGTPIAGRPRAELEGLVGCFMNTLVLRNTIDPTSSFGAFLERVKSTALDAYAHQELPFEKLVEELRPSRSLGHSPLFQVLFALQNAPRHNLEIPGISFEAVPLASRTAKFDLTCSFTESDEGLDGSLEYNTDLFDEATIRRMARHYELLLQGICEDPGTQVKDLRLLTPQEEMQILVEWNVTQTDHPKNTSIHQLFDAQVRRDADAVAVVYEGEQLTYGELNARANQLARGLRSQGVGPEVLVGICAERSLEMVVGLLAVLKAGGAYVPLDPGYPPDRLAYMLQDAAPKVLLTQERLLAQLPASEAKVLCLDRDWPQFEPYAQDDLENLTRPDNLAYVIYTSGSTGRPKGVAVRQAGLVNFLQAMAREPGLCRGDVVLGLTSLSFDISVLELYLPLTVGARIVLASTAHAQDPQRLCRLLEQYRVSLVQATPTSWHMLMEQGWRPDWPVKALCGGEPLPAALMRRLAERFGAVWNMYGPTETTVWSSLACLSADADAPTIGRPIANTRIHILDAQLRPVPVGVAGELHIGGEGLARGYLNSPELNAEKFIADPFGVAGSRLYKTGDLARYRVDGSIEYLGRIDNQMKLRGFRIEPGEIESLLEAQPQVDRAAVVLREDGPEDKRLVAYLVARGAPPEPELLAATLSRQLPTHMVPRTYVVLDALPMTPNGKLNRKSLPAPAEDGCHAPRAHAEPRTSAEIWLAKLWRGILRLDTIGRHDDFFELGGHSLLVLQLAARIADETGRSIQLTELFRRSTLAEQAVLLETESPAQAHSEGAAVWEDVDHVLTPGQRRLWLFQQMFPGSCAYHMSGTINVPAGVLMDAGRLRELVAILHARHDALRLVFRQVDGEPRQRLHPAMALDLTFCEPADEAEFEARSAALVRSPFDLAQGPLFRILCASLPTGQRIVWIIHHIVGDGVSLRILADELKDLLEQGALAAGAEAQRRRGFLDFVRDQPNAGRHDAARAYWMEKYRSLPVRVDLPYDYAIDRTADGALAAFAISAPAEMLGSLRDLCVAERVTPFTVLYAAFAVLLHKITGAADLVVGVPFAGRSDPKMRDVVGFFVNTAAMRTRIDPHASFRALVRQVKTDLFQAFLHQDYPFDQVVEDIGVPVEAGRFPLTSVFLNMLTLTASEAGLMRLQDGHRLVRGDAKFDMDWYLLKWEDALLVDCHYRSELFLPETVEFIARTYLKLLSRLASEADAPMVACSVPAQLPATGAAAFPFDLAGTPRSVIDAFVWVAALHPDAIALRQGASTLTYAALDVRRIALAASLRKAGVTAGARVALLYRPSEDMVVALLAALTVGATYVPLDPYHPVARLATICGDCAPALLMAGQDCRPVAEQLAATAGVPLHAGLHGSVTAFAATASADTTEDAGGYILYTSGSTGRPKGVLQSQRNVLQHARAYIASLGLDTRDNLLLLASYSFDAAVMDIFGALLSGATLTIVDFRFATPVSLRRLIDEVGVTVLHVTPTMFRHVLGDAEGCVLAGLRWVILGGEPAAARDLQLFEACTSRACRLVNGLGPTECTLALQFHTGHGVRVPQPVPAGFPVPGVDVFLEGEGVAPLAFHEGEIILRSEALALGYWGLPQETATAFAMNAAGQRCYRTGDLGRRWIDGSIRPLGRRDQQLKVRGVRVEPMEVEHAIRSVPGLAECVCRGEQSADGSAELVVFCQWKAGASPDYRAVRNAVARSLPSAMWPSRYCTVERIPLTPTGKIDRARVHENATPEDVMRAAPAQSQPFTRVESLVCEAVGTILCREGITLADNFFALGGNSLQALRLVSAVSDDMGVEIPLHELFGAFTLRDVADVIERQVMLRGLLSRPVPAGDVETLRF